MVDKDGINQGGDEGIQVNNSHLGKVGPSFVGGFIPIGNAGMAALKVLKSPDLIDDSLVGKGTYSIIGKDLDQTDCTEVSIPMTFVHTSGQSDTYFFKPFNKNIPFAGLDHLKNFTIKDLFVGMRFKGYANKDFGYVIGFSDSNFDNDTKIKFRLYSESSSIDEKELSFDIFNTIFQISLEDYYGMSLSCDYEPHKLFTLGSLVPLVGMGFIDSESGNRVEIESLSVNAAGVYNIRVHVLGDKSKVIFDGNISRSDFNNRFLLPLEYTSFLKEYGDTYKVKFNIVDGKLKLFHNMIIVSDLKWGDLVWIPEEGICKFSKLSSSHDIELITGLDNLVTKNLPISYNKGEFLNNGLICNDSIRDELVDSAKSALLESNHEMYNRIKNRNLSFILLLSHGGFSYCASMDSELNELSNLLSQLKLDIPEIRLNHLNMKNISNNSGGSDQIGIASLNIRGNDIAGIQIPEFMKGIPFDEMHLYMKFKKTFEDAGYSFNIDPAKLVGDVFPNNWLFMSKDLVTDQLGNVVQGLAIDNSRGLSFITHLAKLGSKILSIEDVLILTHIVYLKFGDKIDKLGEGIIPSGNTDATRLLYDISKFLGIGINEKYNVVNRKSKNIGVKGLFQDVNASNNICFIWKGLIDIEIPKDPYVYESHEHTGVRYVF